MKFILIPNSLKRMLNSSQICVATNEKIKKYFPGSRAVPIPVTDGEEGSVDAFIMAVGGVKEYITVKSPYFEDMKSYSGLIDGGRTAVIEMVSCVGFPLVESRKDPRLITTCGVGQLIPVAAGKGVKEIIVGLGGSSTNGDGCDAAAAAGIRFHDRGGREFIPTGGTTTDIDRINLSGRGSLLKQVEITTMCDTDNSMYGPAGVSSIFGPQKGVDEVMVSRLDEGIRNLSRAVTQTTGADISQVSGTRAAGAMGAGMTAFSSSRLQTGVQTVLGMVKFDEIIGDADHTLTGGGKLDSQSLRGKVVIGIAKGVNKQAKAVVAVVGGVGGDEVGKVYDIGMTMVLPINRFPRGPPASRHRSQENLAYTVDNIIRLVKAGQGGHQV